MCFVSENSTIAYGSLQNYVLNQITMLPPHQTDAMTYSVFNSINCGWLVQTPMVTFNFKIIKHVVPHPHLTQLSIWPKEDKLLIYNLPLKDLTPELCFPYFHLQESSVKFDTSFPKRIVKSFSSSLPPNPNSIMVGF